VSQNVGSLSKAMMDDIGSPPKGLKFSMAKSIMGDIVGQHKVTFGKISKVDLMVKGGFGPLLSCFIVL
jgi:hypothetical protein